MTRLPINFNYVNPLCQWTVGIGGAGQFWAAVGALWRARRQAWRPWLPSSRHVPLAPQNVRIDPSSLSFGMWKDIPVPFYLSIYFFDVINPKEVLQGKKPEVQERGPYVYR